MNEIIRKADDNTLYALSSDIGGILELRNYKLNKNDSVIMIWIQLGREIQAEIDRRLFTNYMEG